MRYIIMGTAGHIDHGKSALVKALTGTDPDRLKEEKERGITIDLGFADLSYPDGLDVGIVDVPGHERLVRNMLAGAGGIDIVLFVIAADEGIMPQSREHLAICNLLNIKSGLVALTKSDLVDKDWLDLVIEEVREFVKGTFLEGTEIIPVSSKTGHNLDQLKEKIHAIALRTEPKRSNGLFRLPIDRVFTLKGFGTVVTGTALSGSLSVDDAVEIQPSGVRSKVRGLQSHGQTIRTAHAGQRVAINLQGVEKDEIGRGDVVVPPDKIIPTRVLDTAITLLRESPEVKSRSQVHLHIGTSEVIARVILYNAASISEGEKAYCQLRLQDKIIVMAGDRFVIRRLSPVETIGGGIVLDSVPSRRRKKDSIDDLVVFDTKPLKEKLSAKLRSMGSQGMTVNSLEGWIDEQRDAIRESMETLKREGVVLLIDTTLFHREVFTGLQQSLTGILRKFHRENPLKPGMPKEEVRRKLRMENRMFMSFLSRIPDIVASGEDVRLKDFTITMSGVDEAAKGKIYDMIHRNLFKPPSKEEVAKALSKDVKEIGDILKILVKEGKAVRINDSIYLSKENADKLLDRLKEFFSKKQEMTVAEFRDFLDTTRKYALPYLEYLDTAKITIRVGEGRKLLKK
ncbi:MAG: selenocysteine-specific translation elongation factor [bacterium]